MVVFSFVLSACGRSSYEDFREEGKGITRSLVKELKKIHSRDDLLTQAPQLERLFLSLAQVILAVREFEVQNPQQSPPALSVKDRALSDQLRNELNRIYQLEGGKEVLDQCRESSLKLLRSPSPK